MSTEHAPATGETTHETIDFERALGPAWDSLPESVKARARNASPTNDAEIYNALKKAADLDAGAVPEVTPSGTGETVKAPRKKLGIRRLVRGALGLPLVPFKAVRAGYRLTERATTAAYGWHFDRNKAFKDKYDAMTEEEKQAHVEKIGKWSARGVVAALGAMGMYTAYRAAGLDSMIGSTGTTAPEVPAEESVNPSVAPGANPNAAPGAQDVAAPEVPADPPQDEDVVLTGNHSPRDPQGSEDLSDESTANRARGIDEYPFSESYSRQQETTFLNENGRHGNDFNNITGDKLYNNPGDKDQFIGYTALHEQYSKSPNELASQLLHIQQIELEKGNDLGILPQEWQLQAGESEEAYIARLGDTLHADHEIHDTLTDITLAYIKENGQPLSDLTENYSAFYIEIIDGKPVVKIDPSVVSADPTDKVIMLSDTKGIRIPCGQGIELKEDEIIVTEQGTSYSYAAEQTQRGSTQPTGTTATHPSGGSHGGGNTPGGGGGGGNPGNPSNPGGGGGGGEHPPTDHEGKPFDGHVDMPDGLGPNGFIEQTLPPEVTGNGTQSPNLTGNELSGSESGLQDQTAQSNTDQQVKQRENGAGDDNRTEADKAEKQAQKEAEREQREADKKAEKAEREARDAEKEAEAVRNAQDDMDSSGRPRNIRQTGGINGANGGSPSGGASSGGGESSGSGSSGGSEQ